MRYMTGLISVLLLSVSMAGQASASTDSEYLSNFGRVGGERYQ